MTDHVEEAEYLLRRAAEQEAEWATALALQAIGHLLLAQAQAGDEVIEVQVDPEAFGRITKPPPMMVDPDILGLTVEPGSPGTGSEYPERNNAPRPAGRHWRGWVAWR